MPDDPRGRLLLPHPDRRPRTGRQARHLAELLATSLSRPGPG
ncbi:hypothetical protein [Nonomuraea sp. NPDC003201]